MKTVLCSITILSLLSLVLSQTTTSTASSATYTNPILDTVGADPWVIQYGSYYYMTYTTSSNITMLRSSVLTDWNNADAKLAFEPPANTSYSYDLWAPELHNLNGLWYIIFTADVDPDMPSPEVDMLCDFGCPAVHHRMFVLESSGSDPWTSDYTMKAELDTYNQFAIDGTYFQHSSGLYHIYSCWYGPYISWPSMLCISELSDPWTVSSPLSARAIISKPDNAWEKTPYGRTINVRLSSNEGPEQLTNPYTNQTFVIYSAARSDNRDYCLGLLELTGDDPMDPASWYKNNDYCVFYQDPTNQVYGVGHASFTKSPDGTQDWVVYHGMKNYENGWSDRTIRTQQFFWDSKTGWPIFPRPGYGPYDVPSGQNTASSATAGSSMKTQTPTPQTAPTVSEPVPPDATSEVPSEPVTPSAQPGYTYQSPKSPQWGTSTEPSITTTW